VPDITRVEQLEGKRIGTILGYHYPALEPMWKAGRSTRVNDLRTDLLMRALMVKVTDVAIESELEFATWAKANPHESRALKMHPMVFTSTPTMCAVSLKGNVTVRELNLGIDKLEKTGQIRGILKRYQWHN
jgi:ABC-type amino acid transport substrate-binding protein